jgi:predicted kinase
MKTNIIQSAIQYVFWTPPYIRHKMNNKQTKYTIQYVLDTTIHKTQDEDNQNKIHNTIYVGHHYAQTSIDN